jgi:hypothetical protein
MNAVLNPKTDTWPALPLANIQYHQIEQLELPETLANFLLSQGCW